MMKQTLEQTRRAEKALANLNARLIAELQKKSSELNKTDFKWQIPNNSGEYGQIAREISLTE